MRFDHLALSLLTLFIIAGCEINGKDTKVQYMPDMADAPTAKAQESFLEPPLHSMAINATIYPETPEAAEAELQNPFPHNEDTISAGKAAYDTFCIPCHGPGGKGDHALGEKYPTPPDITAAVYKARKDGFFFHRITFGSALMPGYGHSTTVDERWKIIHYLRQLQNH